MEIIEQTIVPKNQQNKSEDGIVVTDDFIAVIDGSTSKTKRRYSLFHSNGEYAMQLVSKYIKGMAKTTTCHAFCTGVTAYIQKRYKKSQLSWLALHPEERLTVSAIIFSRLNREVWMIGDCQCLIGGQYYDTPKPYEQELAELRASYIAASNMTQEDFLTNDTAREHIIPRMLEAMKEQNKTYAVIDGFPIPEQKVRIITLDFQPWEIVFATDGYPTLCPTLEESEQKLQWQKDNDPLNIGQFKATKAFAKGNNSFDDRAYIRFKV